MCYVMYMYIYIYITRRTHTSVYDRDCDIPQNNVPLSKQPEFHALFLFGSGEVLQPPSKPGPAIFVLEPTFANLILHGALVKHFCIDSA